MIDQWVPGPEDGKEEDITKENESPLGVMNMEHEVTLS